MGGITADLNEFKLTKGEKKEEKKVIHDAIP